MISYSSNTAPYGPFTAVPIVCLDLKGNKLTEFESISEASSKLNINHSNIHRNVIGVTCKCYNSNFIFIKKEKYKEGMLITYESLKRKKLLRKGKLKTVNISNIKYA